MPETKRTELLKEHFSEYRKNLNDLLDLVDLDIVEQII